MKNSMLYSDRGSWNTLQQYIFDCCSAHADLNCCIRSVDGRPVFRTYRELLHSLQVIGTYLASADAPGKHAALLGRTSYDWIASYLGALCYGITAVPLDRALPKQGILDQFVFADADILIYDEQYEETAQYIAEKTGCAHLICINGTSRHPVTAERLEQEGRVITPPAETPERMAEIVFTSGTTGKQKGVMLSYGNILYTVMLGIRLIQIQSPATVLSIMPNNHTYELTVGILTPLYFGATRAVMSNQIHFRKELTVFRPAIILTVPAMMSMLQKEILQETERRQEKTAADIVSTICGGRLKTLICGGAFLPGKLKRFFESLGIAVIEGYGITECSPIVSCNSDRASRRLGVISPYCEVKCIDGEICVRGKNVMLGYYKNPEATQRAMADGWFHTGDLGDVDEQNCLSLTGRIDRLIINSNGENISPEEIENRLSSIELISGCVVYSEDDLIAAEIHPNYELAEQRQITGLDKILWNEVQDVNASMPRKMRVERIHFREKPFEMTTSMKIKKNGKGEDTQ